MLQAVHGETGVGKRDFAELRGGNATDDVDCVGGGGGGSGSLLRLRRRLSFSIRADIEVQFNLSNGPYFESEGQITMSNCGIKHLDFAPVIRRRLKVLGLMNKARDFALS